jgi:hypothetical protein
MTFKTLMASAAVLAAMTLAPAAYAETVTTRTLVQPAPLPGLKQVDFTVFDINGDGFYSMPEVGERLFHSFDKDGNGHIDNIEWDHKAIMTITPMTKETFKFVDMNDDGMVENSTYTYQTFYTASGLSMFDEHKDGLSAKEFIGVGYRKLDRDDDNQIGLEEWKQAYLESRPRELDPANYNN